MKDMETKTDVPTAGDSSPAPCSPFEWRLNTTDGSDPLDILEDEDGCMVYQGDFVVGVGQRLLEAWNDYLYPLSPKSAPVNDADLAAMWSAYDKANAKLSHEEGGKEQR